MSASEIPKNNIKRGRAVIATLVATQVDIIFLTNHDQRQYSSPALPIASQVDFRASEIGSLARGRIPSFGRLRFSENSNRSIDVEWFVPLENVYHEIHGDIRKRHNFEMVDWRVFDGVCYALQCERRCLEKDKGFSKPVSHPTILDFLLGRHGE